MISHDKYVMRQEMINKRKNLIRSAMLAVANSSGAKPEIVRHLSAHISFLTG